MNGIKRKAAIITLLEERREVDVSTLSAQFGISKETIRRDLSALEREGILTRTHGGAVYNGPGRRQDLPEYPVNVRSIQRYTEKNAICRYAASLVEEGDTVFVDNSSTTMYLPHYLPGNLRAVVLTNSMQLLLEALKAPNPGIQYICFGGIFRESNLSYYGSTTLKNAAEYYPDKAFLSCTGLSGKGVVTDASLQEVDVKRLMMEQSRKLYLLADHTKFDKLGQVYLGDLTRDNAVITDENTSANHHQLVTGLGAELLVAPTKG